MEDRLITTIPCAHCMALINVPVEEYHVCTHFHCPFCGKITNISQIFLGARWNWTLKDESRLNLPSNSQLSD